MNRDFYSNLTISSLNRENFSDDLLYNLLQSNKIELLPLLNAAYQIRKKFCGKEVSIHIINNAQNGFCPEDCHYCPQAKSSNADINEYPLKPDHEIMDEAKAAYESGAHRYCMVFAGRGPSDNRVNHLAEIIKTIKAQYPIEICVSAGLLDNTKAKILKEAGLDRLNHNLNTSENHYPQICTTHTFADRLNTLRAASDAGLQLCSGIIVGMGEEAKDIIEVAQKLREVKAKSIPVNFLVPIDGNVLDESSDLTPEFCLRVLCLFRFLNPDAEIRVAAGRELHFRSMEVLSLYPANSLFMDGYLNTQGDNRKATLQMIKDAGFIIKSDQNLDFLIEEETRKIDKEPAKGALKAKLKGIRDLRPHLENQFFSK